MRLRGAIATDVKQLQAFPAQKRSASMLAGEMHTVRVAFACCSPQQRQQLIHEAPVSIAAVLHVNNYGHLHLLALELHAATPW